MKYVENRWMLLYACRFLRTSFHSLLHILQESEYMNFESSSKMFIENVSFIFDLPNLFIINKKISRLLLSN